MNLNSLYKREGIENIQKINKKEINAIARDIAIKLCLAFPEHNLDRKYLFDTISSITMYTANMNLDSSGAKYLPDTNSIYFNNQLSFEEFPDVAMHECIHFLQMNHSKVQMGLYNYHSHSGIAINEAAVQLMASEANMCNTCDEKLFGINLKTNTPNYYPLEVAILKQMAYFVGNYTLYSSTLNSNDNFKHEFISKFNKRIYNFIVKNLDNLLNLENDIHYYINELAHCTKNQNIKVLNNVITAQKKDIASLFFKIQNYIIRNCFCIEYSNINNNETLYNFKNSLYYFKDVIGYTDNYTYYNDFYRDMMNALEIKKKQINCLDDINLSTSKTQSLIVIDKKRPSLVFMYNTIKRLKKLIGIKIPN